MALDTGTDFSLGTDAASLFTATGLGDFQTPNLVSPPVEAAPPTANFADAGSGAVSDVPLSFGGDATGFDIPSSGVLPSDSSIFSPAASSAVSGFDPSANAFSSTDQLPSQSSSTVGQGDPTQANAGDATQQKQQNPALSPLAERLCHHGGSGLGHCGI